ncbi:extracellular solute-binding protein [Streptomyces sp. KM273126]|uniref:extracellular solute-binding protein n=1 Tax=Streptomyces sp. KM273126 TaxID=2545247 RepID=UPI00215D8993|nr:extracellular solute-binding protein [Streptomyces sp. KM273126]
MTLQSHPSPVLRRYFAKKGLASLVDEVWETMGDGFNDAAKQLSRGEDGKYCFVPLYEYPLAVFYRKGLFVERGYQVPRTWDEFVGLARRMRKDCLSPVSSGYGGGDRWSVLGAFGYLNLRANGYDFRTSMLRGETSWTDKRTARVLDPWRELTPRCQRSGDGRSRQDAARSLLDKKTGMAVIGLFLGRQVTDEEIRADRDSDPGFISTVFLPGLTEWLGHPDDGAPVWRQFFQIVLPLCRPAFAALATLESIWIYNDIFWPLTLIETSDKQPITSALANLQGQYFTNSNLIAVGVLMTAIPTLLVHFALRRRFISGLTLGSGRG